MAEVSAYEAKTHFSQLLARAEKGERIVITKHGRQVAALVPLKQEPARSFEEVLRSVAEIRKGNRLDGISIRELIDEGRKW
jgi:prevent-host-death family protein